MLARGAFRVDPLESAQIDSFLLLGLSPWGGPAARGMSVQGCASMESRRESRREALLQELCVRYGFCNELDSSALIGADSGDEVVDAVFVAEGWDPVMCDRETKAYLEQAVDDWLFNPRGRGAKSSFLAVLLAA
jgi:hypothetical protein